MKSEWKCQKLEAASKSQSILIEPRVKMPDIAEEINMTTVWYKRSISLYLIAVKNICRESESYIAHFNLIKA